MPLSFVSQSSFSQICLLTRILFVLDHYNPFVLNNWCSRSSLVVWCICFDISGRLFPTGQYSLVSRIKSTWFLSMSDPSTSACQSLRYLERVIPIIIPDGIMLLMGSNATESFMIFWKVKQKIWQFSNRFNKPKLIYVQCYLLTSIFVIITIHRIHECFLNVHSSAGSLPHL